MTHQRGERRTDRRPGRRAALVAVAVLGLLATALGLAGCGSSEPLVVVYGDSLMVESGGAVSFLLADDVDVDVQAYGGTATCDYAERIEAAARERHPALIVVQFNGNALTPCMRPDGVAPRWSRVEAEYRTDTEALIDAVAPTGVPLLFIGAPPPPLDRQVNDDVVSEVVAEQAALGRDVAFVDAGDALAGPDGGWSETLPCLPDEDAAAGCDDGRIVVRSADGYHFCPGTWDEADGSVGECPVWSSGAWRYGSRIADAISARV